LGWLVKRFIDYGTASDMHDDIEDAFQKMHRNLATPDKTAVHRLKTLMPIYIKPVEPVQTFNGNWIAP
jgi:hypothetical protein